MKIKKIIFIFLFAIVLSFYWFISTIVEASSYVWSNSSTGLLETVSDTETNLNLESDGAILIEQSTGTVLYEHNSREKFRPASVTKVMSLLLIMEAIDNRRTKTYRYSFLL